MSPRPRHRRSAATQLRGLGYLAVWALLVVAPFYVVFTANEPFRLPKLLAAEWLGLASLLALALAAAFRGEDRADPALPGWRRPAFLAVAPVLAVASLGLVASSHPEHTRQALPDLWIAGSCLVGWSLALDAGRLRRLLRWLPLPAALMAGLGVLQFHGVFQPFRFLGGVHNYRLGVTSLAGNAGDLAAYLVLPGLVAQWRLLETLAGPDAPRGRRHWLRAGSWAFVLIAILYGIAATQSLTPAAALAAGSAVFWLATLPVRRALTAVVAGAIVLATLVAGVPELRERLAGVGRLLAQNQLNAALTGRLDGWNAALWMVKEHPWTGVGHGAYRAEFGTAKLALQNRGVEFFEGHTDPFFANAHNDLLEAAAEWGLPGVAALAWGLWVLGRSVIGQGARTRAPEGARASRRAGTEAPGGDGRGGRPFALAGTAAALLLALGQFPFHLALVAYPFLVFLAWVFRQADPEVEP
ncbi:MAG TPA: O-antigen ligase family protein [Thermoanaerobaculia bacterium]|nr:O-antigen ligase family protein [Thermoanaerobaculia bacterium]